MNKIKEKRKILGLNQNQLAKAVGVTDSAICQYESGKRNPNILILKKMATVLGCSVDDLIKEDK